jgi:hypothetical protein
MRSPPRHQLLRLSLGTVLCAFSGLSIVLTMILQPFPDGAWYAFPLGFLTGLGAGLGVTLVLYVLISSRRQ